MRTARPRRRVAKPHKSGSVSVKVAKYAIWGCLCIAILFPIAYWFSSVRSSPDTPRQVEPGFRGYKAGLGGEAGVPIQHQVASVKARRDPTLEKITILILCKDELKSLEASLQTWDKGGVLDYADEVLLYFQGRNPKKDKFLSKYTSTGKITKILGDRRLFPIGQAVNWLVGNASNPIVMFLEKDFALVEDEQYVVPRLDDGRLMLKTGEADVIRYRSRLQAGEPNYAEGMFKDREHVILQRQPNLYCSVHYWLTNEVLDNPPHKRYIWRCPNTRAYYCTKAKFCNWTNNPQMFYRDWFMKHFYDRIEGIMKLKPPQNDLEFFMNWEHDVWNNADITVAMGEGLFTHREIGEHAAIDFASLRKAEEHGDNYQDCDIGRRFTKEQCLNHRCKWEPGHPIATCIGENGRLEDCGATDEASCRAMDRCFWNPWTVWLPSSCVRDKLPPLDPSIG